MGKPKTLASSINAPKSTRGLEMRKLNVTPLESPALVKPINMGMDEQLQKGVTVPKSAPIAFAQMPLYLPSNFFVRSGGK